MNEKYRRTDSLAYATGSFKNNLEDIIQRWSDIVISIVDVSPKLIEDIKNIVKNRTNASSKKTQIMSVLTNLGKLLADLEKVNAENYSLMIEMGGLDFPLKGPKKMITVCKDEEEEIGFLQTILRNLSKTMTFIEKGDTEEELLMNSLKSYEDAFNQFQELTDKAIQLFSYTAEELDKEHKKARKYLGIV
ncbi:MAG: hypothetical protein H7645_03920 [Candidatus Heimdallarchaeota archaeon]|nr:hypothetical protein [Candidatus Heimdallarchaeota archaeon]MCK4769464.1 hypothetical protein [Candidatus Heimdallarchaeota archaeon]